MHKIAFPLAGPAPTPIGTPKDRHALTRMSVYKVSTSCQQQQRLDYAKTALLLDNYQS